MDIQDYFIKVHSHSCLELRWRKTSILFDPWLIGSAYWRSWWNFPEPTPVETLIKDISNCEEVYIYLTHLHWDHFHGPTLRKIFKEIPKLKFIISRVPEKRLVNDLFNVLNKKIHIIEINHGEEYFINPKLTLKPFLSGPILTDSAVLIKKEDDYILNLNDSKQQGLMSKQIISSINNGDLKVMLRSHSSANSRLCIKNRDGSDIKNIDKSKQEYSIDFLESASLFNPKIAIPFASNMCYLHKDTFKFNKYSNTSDLLENFSQSSSDYENINVQLVLPGEELNLHSLRKTINKDSRNQLFSNRKRTLKKYREKHLKKLEKAESLQEKTNFSEKIISTYFQLVFLKLPPFLRFFARGKIAFYEKNKIKKKNFFIVDIFNKKISFNNSKIKDCHTVIYVKAGVLNTALAQKNLNSLGISKLFEVHTESIKKYNFFFNLCIAAEIGSIPFNSKNQLFRCLKIWRRRWREILDYTFVILKLKKLIQ